MDIARKITFQAGLRLDWMKVITEAERQGRCSDSFSSHWLKEIGIHDYWKDRLSRS
jgi:hypothetical protein